MKFHAFREISCLSRFRPLFWDKKKRAGRPRSLSPSPHRRLRLAVTSHPILVTRELAQAHGAAGVEFVGGDADFGAEAEFAAVGEAVGDVVENAGGVDRAQEAIGSGLICSDNGVGVM